MRREKERVLPRRKARRETAAGKLSLLGAVVEEVEDEEGEGGVREGEESVGE